MVGMALGVPISLGLLALAVRGLDTQRMLRALADADPIEVAGGVAAIGLLYGVQAARWRYVCRHVCVLPWRTFLRFVVSGVAVNNVVPGRPGDLLRGFWLARAAPCPQATAFGTVIVDRSADVLVLLAMLSVTYTGIDHPAWLDRVLVGALALGVAVAVLLVIISRQARGTLRSGVSAGSGRLRRQWRILADGAATSLTRRDVCAIGGMTVIVWLLWGVAAWLVAASVGISLSPWDVAFITSLINLGSAIPSSPGFVGTFQWLAVAGLGLLSVDHADAFAFSLLMHAVWYVPTTLAGAVLWLRAGAGWVDQRLTVEPPPA